MKKILAGIILLVAGYFVWQEKFYKVPLEPLYATPYVVVYGKDRCGWTQKYLRDFESKKINCIYKSVDNKEVSDELHPRMVQAGLNVRRYNLPVIDVNARILIRPDLDLVLEILREE